MSLDMVGKELDQMAEELAAQAAPATVELTPHPRDRVAENISVKHEALIDFIVMHPHLSQEEVGAVFGYKQGYISKLINSGLFRAKLAERRLEFFSAATQTNREKLEELSAQVLDRLLVKVQVEQDTARLAKVAEIALKAAGYVDSKPPPAPTLQQNNFYLQPVQREILAQAREANAKRFVEPKLIDGETTK